MNTGSKRLRASACLLCLVFGLQIVARGQQTGNPNSAQLKSEDVYRLVIKGHKLSSTEAENLEKTLAADPQDLATRLTLFSYYVGRHEDPFNLKRSEHALWLIRNVPDSE